MAKFPSSYRHQAHECVGSTNKLALKAAADGDPGQLWVTALEQTEGRGRRGRAWVSQPGNLYASLLLLDPAPKEAIPQLPLVFATAVHRAITDLVQPNLRAEITVKWPNDILFGNAKVCGILLENSNLANGQQAIVIGIGVNCRSHPDETEGLDAANLSASGFDLDPAVLFDHLAMHVAERLDCWDQGRGLAVIRQDWVQRARGIGQPVVVRLPDATLTGRFEQLDEQGGLVLLQDNGQRRTIYAGDVFWPS